MSILCTRSCHHAIYIAFLSGERGPSARPAARPCLTQSSERLSRLSFWIATRREPQGYWLPIVGDLRRATLAPEPAVRATVDFLKALIQADNTLLSWERARRHLVVEL